MLDLGIKPCDAISPDQGTACCDSGPVIAVVLSSFGQPSLMSEAIEAVLSQRSSKPIGLVIVNDGCTLTETSAVASAYASAYPKRVWHLRRSNGGLSAARNTGVEFVLTAWPGCQAVFFLDADNRLQPDLLERAWETLQAGDARTGWSYCDIDMFGFAAGIRTGGPFSGLRLIHQNMCDAGSLVARTVLDAGVRFDESMRDGFEDWDFWLQALTAGFEGRHVADGGFLYRKRAESMLIEAERKRAVLVNQLRTKHRHLLAPRSLLAREHAEVPRFAVVSGDHAFVALTSDPDRLEDQCIPRVAFRAKALATFADPVGCPLPPYFLFADRETLEALAAARVLHGLIWRAEALAKDHAVVAIQPITESEELSLRIEIGCSWPLDAAVILVRTTAVLQSMAKPLTVDTTDLMSFLGDHSGNGASSGRILVNLPKFGMDLDHAAWRNVAGDVASELKVLRTKAASHGSFREWRATWRLETPKSHAILEELVGCSPMLPLLPDSGRQDIAFVVPIFTFGGVEGVVANQARAFRARGWRTHLVVAGTASAESRHLAPDSFDTITIAADLDDASRTGEVPTYFGCAISDRMLPGKNSAFLGLLATMDVVVMTNSPEALSMAGALRRLGVKTVASLHVLDCDRFGRRMGTSNLLLAHEHAVQFVTVISEELRNWCSGAGIPTGKIKLVPNAPSYRSDPSRVVRSIAAKRAYDGARPLRLLFLGRFDVQKGLDRLVALAARCREATLPVEWRVVGRKVLDGGGDPDLSALGIVPEPPALTVEALDRLYEWADILVMPSRYEGVPLTVLEAQQMGVVPICTRVGAIHEAILHDEDGLIITSGDEANILAGFEAEIRKLIARPTEFHRLSTAARARAAAQDWDKNLSSLFEALGTIPSKARGKRGGVGC